MEPDNWSRMSEEDLLDHFRKDDADFKSFYEFNTEFVLSPLISHKDLESPAGMLEEELITQNNIQELIGDHHHLESDHSINKMNEELIETEPCSVRGGQCCYYHDNIHRKLHDEDEDSDSGAVEPVCDDDPIVITVTRQAQDEIFTLYAGDDCSYIRGVLEDPVFCNCSKTGCSKMYCACFRQGLPCTTKCRCCSCSNTLDNIEYNREQRQLKLSLGSSYLLASAEELSCSCRNSFCQKGYCPCHRNKRACTVKCQCFNCKNTEYHRK